MQFVWWNACRNIGGFQNFSFFTHHGADFLRFIGLCTLPVYVIKQAKNPGQGYKNFLLKRLYTAGAAMQHAPRGYHNFSVFGAVPPQNGINAKIQRKYPLNIQHIFCGKVRIQ